MQNARLFLLLLTTLLIGAKCSQDAGTYFKRPNIEPCISNGDGTSWCNGELTDNINHITQTADNFDRLVDYCEDKETRLFICLKYPSRCK
jgi:hypothetical protein